MKMKKRMEMKRTRLVLIIMVVVFTVVLLGCKREEPKSSKPPVSQNSGAIQSKSFLAFDSEHGEYEIPLHYSVSAAVAGVAEIGILQNFIRQHSTERLWTYILHPMEMVNPETGKIELPQAGVDQFAKYYGEDMAQVVVKWAPIVSDVKQEFQQARAVLQRDASWSDDSELEIVIDGHTGICWRYIMDVDGTKTHNTFVLVHSGKKRYEIVFSYTGRFSDPDNTFDKIKAIKFK